MDNNGTTPSAKVNVQGKKLLVVEDDFYMKDLYRMQAESKGYIVATAANGTEGITQAEAFIPDIILLDLMLPNADGIEVVRTLRTKDDFKNTPVIIITNYDAPDTEQRAREAGATDYVLKIAYTPDMVTDKLQSYFS
jgi:CheY-like chemotaxis protein